MVLLGALGLDLDGMRSSARASEAPPPSAHAAVAALDMTCCCYIIHPRVTCANPARRKGLSGVVDCFPLRSWQLLAGGRMVTRDVWVTLRQSCFTAV